MAKKGKKCCTLMVNKSLLFLVCYYQFMQLYVEHKAVEMPGYKAACDIEAIGVSCSKVFTSKYGRMMSYFGFVEEDSDLDQPNAVLGILFYGITFILPYLTFIPGTISKLGMFLASAYLVQVRHGLVISWYTYWKIFVLYVYQHTLSMLLF